MVAAGGVRYVKVQAAWDRPGQRQLATIAHELQHATEIAEAPAIVDDESMAEEYGRRIGFEKDQHHGRRRFESQAAIEAGQRVWREYVFEY